MKHPYLQAWFQRVDATMQKARQYSAGNPELDGYLASYLTVLVSGAYEDCVEHLLSQRAAKTGDAEIANYIQTSVDRNFRNPNFKNILRLITAFSHQYAQELNARVDSKATGAINSIVNNKNDIAHGRSATVTIRDVENYHKRCMPIFEALEDILGVP
jgi:histone H3/H4